MYVINGVIASDDDVLTFWDYFLHGKVAIKYMKYGNTYINIITD